MGFVDWLEKTQTPCFHKSILGVECPGCGMQRALVALLRGNLWESMKLYPALIPTTVMMAFLVIHILFKLKNGARTLLVMFVFNTVIVIVFYLYKLII